MKQGPFYRRRAGRLRPLRQPHDPADRHPRPAFRTAQGYTTANTFFGQLEAGYKLMVAPTFGGFVTPFARLQASTSTQAGFSETGADSLNLTVARADHQLAAQRPGRAARRSLDAPGARS